jgi:hypothetical protein
MAKELKITTKDAQLVQKALAVTADAGDADISGYLPAPLAMQVIAYIRDINIMRKLIRVFDQNARNWRKPKRATGQSAYYIPDGTPAIQGGFIGTNVLWTAKKLMSYCMVDEESVEDSQPDIVAQILEDFAQAVAEAEERVILGGSTLHTATAPDPASATNSNWFIRDPRLAFDGLFTVAGTAIAATSVDAGNTSFDPDVVNKALYNLGKYGRVKSNVYGVMPPDQAANVRGNEKFQKAMISGLALASFITGLGSAGEGDGLVARVFGVNMYEAPFAPAGQCCLFKKDSPEMGDRRKIKFVSDIIVEQDQRQYVVSERISYNHNYPDALVLITNLGTTIVS